MRVAHHHLARQIARPHGVIQTFASDRIHQSAGIAYREPPVPGQAIILPAGMLERRQHVAVEGCILIRDALLVHVAFQARPQRMRRLALAANAHRQMSAAREHPDVALQIRQELDVDVVLRRGHKITQRVHGVGGGPLGANVAQRIARAGGDDAEVGIEHAMPGLETPATSAALDSKHARFFQLRPGILGAIQQHAVQIHPRIDQQGLAQIHFHSAGARGCQTGLADDPFRNGVLHKEWITGIGFVSQPAAAWFLPCQLLIQNNRFYARSRQALCREGSSRTAPEDGNFFH